MEVKPGYKQTEVGVIPEDWEVKKLNMLGVIVRGGSPRPAGDPKFFNGNFIPWLTVAALTNISDSEIFITKTSSKLTELGAKYSRILEPNTVIIANSGATLGVAKILKIRCCANDGIAAIINPNFYNGQFIVCYVNSITNFLREVVATGNGQPNLNTTLIGNLSVPYPVNDEQTAIATALSDVDALISGLDRLIEKKRAIKQAAMQELLTGKRRLPGYDSGKGYKQTEVGEIPEDWDVKTLGSITHLLTNGFVGKATDNYIESDDGVLYIQGYNIEINGFNLHGIKRVSPEFHKNHARSSLKRGDLLTIQTGDIGITAVVPPELEGANCHALIISRIDGKLGSPYYFCQYFNSEYGMRFFKEIETGTTMKHLNTGDMIFLALPIPPLPEQTAIATALSDMDAEISALETRKAKTLSLKQGMMQELLTGRIRLV